VVKLFNAIQQAQDAQTSALGGKVARPDPGAKDKRKGRDNLVGRGKDRKQFGCIICDVLYLDFTQRQRRWTRILSSTSSNPVELYLRRDQMATLAVSKSFTVECTVVHFRFRAVICRFAWIGCLLYEHCYTTAELVRARVCIGFNFLR